MQANPFQGRGQGGWVLFVRDSTNRIQPPAGAGEESGLLDWTSD